MGQRRTSFVPGLWLAAGSLLLTLLAVEIGLRVTRMDLNVLRQGISFTGADLPVHRVSSDPFLHFELRPGAKAEFLFEGRGTYTVTIDEHGARYPTHRRDKAPGTFRILTAGCSTLYGATVNDDETIAAVLERLLNQDKTGPTRFEVWNFGTSAYNLGQSAHLALQKLDIVNPDLVLVQHHNRGRRAWLIPPDFQIESFDMAIAFSDPEFWREQFLPPAAALKEIHPTLMRASAIYRSAVAILRPLPDVGESEYGERLSSAKAKLLYEEAERRRIPVHFFAIPAGHGFATRESIFPELPEGRYLELYREGRDPLFYEMHPPAPYLAEFAAILLEELQRRGALPVVAP